MTEAQQSTASMTTQPSPTTVYRDTPPGVMSIAFGVCLGIWFSVVFPVLFWVFFLGGLASLSKCSGPSY